MKTNISLPATTASLQFLFTLLVSFFLLTSWVSAQESAPAELQKAYETLESDYQRTIKSTPVFQRTLEGIDKKIKAVTSLTSKFEECISENTLQLDSIKSNIKLLGDEKDTEDADVKKQRKALDKRLQDVDNEVKRCNLLKIQLDNISEELGQFRNELVKQQLLRKEDSVFAAFESLTPSTQSISHNLSGLKALLTWKVLIAAMAALLLGFFFRKKPFYHEFDSTKHSSPSLALVVKGLQDTAPILFFLAAVWLTVKVNAGVENADLLKALGFAFIQVFSFAVLRNLVFKGATEKALSSFPRTRMLILLGIAIFFSSVAFLLNEESFGRFSNSTALYYLWIASIIISAVSYIIIIHNSIKILLSKSSSSVYLYIPAAVIVVLIFLAILGYRNLASQLFFGLILSLITLFLVIFLIRISSEFFDSLDQGKISWQRKIRSALSVEKQRAFPGVIWLRMLAFFSILFIGISALISIWGGSQQPITIVQDVFRNGLKIGTFNFDIFNVVYALLILIITLSAIPFIKNRIIANWLKHSNLSSGAKDAIQTLAGYLVIGVVLLWVLFILGMNFQNLAIIAGALSVGIGFGLQNIVNNFVSGLILLFERPIRRGDWVVVGNTEGYVRDISIRSTTIQTFDRADVIVPNSELISNQVTNWMLSNNIGRLKAAVGVAYGSDVSLVIKILSDIADNHPGVITNNSMYPVRVLFMNFGDSSLNFELRCFVKNVDNRLNIQSDINLSIDAEFRKHNIEIPFPQRVVHMDSESLPEEETK